MSCFTTCNRFLLLKGSCRISRQYNRKVAKIRMEIRLSFDASEFGKPLAFSLKTSITSQYSTVAILAKKMDSTVNKNDIDSYVSPHGVSGLFRSCCVTLERKYAVKESIRCHHKLSLLTQLSRLFQEILRGHNAGNVIIFWTFSITTSAFTSFFLKDK